MNAPTTLIDVVCEAPVDAAHWQRLAVAAVDAVTQLESVRFARVSVRVLRDAAMEVLHERYAKEAGTTDVLAFVEQGAGGLEVDVAICHDEAERRAAQLGHAGVDELALYLVHGLLHAAGHTDDTDESCARMRTAEREVLHTLGVGRV
ncbi:MAG: rRNA maturation RNase YbeY [Planctomycetes bacterium]|nr:rRNA maturation RNase YbeY [Planctomycetota bacterium]